MTTDEMISKAATSTSDRVFGEEDDDDEVFVVVAVVVEEIEADEDEEVKEAVEDEPAFVSEGL